MIGFGLSLLTLSAFLCLYRIGIGPTPADRMVGIDILGILVVGFCGLFAIITGRSFYLNIALAWGLLSFIGTTALAKHLEGKKFDE